MNHVLAPGGVFVLEDGVSPRFVPLRPPSDEEVKKVVRGVSRKPPEV